MRIIKSRSDELIDKLTGAYNSDGTLNENFERTFFINSRDRFNACSNVFHKGDTWEKLFDADTSARYLRFSSLQFSKLCFTSDDAPRTITRKMKVRKVDKAAFRFVNEQPDEPFGIEGIAFEYTTTGNYKE